MPKLFSMYLVKIFVSVVLYVPYARGDFKPDSNINVLIVLERLPEDIFESHRMLDKAEEELGGAFERFRELGYNPVLLQVVLDRDRHPSLDHSILILSLTQ